MIRASSRPGYVFLIAILFIGSIALVSSLSLALLSWAWEQNGKTFADAAQALEMARACMERGIRTLQLDPLYAGGDTLSVSSDVTCTVVASEGEGNTYRTLCVEGKSGPTVKRLSIRLDTVLPTPHIASYKEVETARECDTFFKPLSSSSSSISSSSSS